MSDARTAARVHELIKWRIMQGAWAPAHALNLREIAETSGTSIVPVRDALQRLVGQGLVEPRAGGGFAVPDFSAEDIGHLYAWHGDLVALALRADRNATAISTANCDEMTSDRTEIADRAADFFFAIGAASTNPEHLKAIRTVGDRLHLVRLCEDMVLKPEAELAMLTAAWRTASSAQFRRLVATYHRRRVRCAPALAVAVETRGRNALGGASKAGTYKISYMTDRR